ncbi:MAG: type VI secretion system protein TssL [Gammaproteobacteria bacterium]|nr:MAG: type VI secretion system protein TssL [Gammaproteobacteria bacterium]
MSDDDDKAPGAPAWMATFADLMSLLMCFFVLLLSFSEMDVLKYKQMAGSMRNAFGVQDKIQVKDSPKGTSVIAREFSPGKTTPTPIKTVQQVSSERTKPSLRVGDADGGQLTKQQARELLQQKLSRMIEETKADAEKLKRLLRKSIKKGHVEVTSKGRTIRIRIRERGSFASGSAQLKSEFVPVVNTMRKALREIEGHIAVEGHTDNIPISTVKFRSNWELSASRALSVVHALGGDDGLTHDRFMVIGRADTQPLDANDTWEGRAKNRRVEVVIRQGLDPSVVVSLRDLREDEPDAVEELDLNTLDITGEG